MTGTPRKRLTALTEGAKVTPVELPALGDLALLAVIMVGLTMLEVSKFSLARDEIRHHGHSGKDHSGQDHSS